MQYVRADYDAPAGHYHVEWKVKDANHVRLQVSVPFDCRAELLLPWAKDFSDRALEAGEYAFDLETREPLIITHSLDEPLGLLLDNPRTKAALAEADSSIFGIPHAVWGTPLRELLAERPGGGELIRKLEKSLGEIREE